MYINDENINENINNKNINNEHTKLDKIFNDMQNDINNSIFNKIATLDGELLFKYLILFAILLKFFNYINISVSQFISIIFTLTIIYIIYDKDKIYNNTQQKSINFKLNSIYPQPKYFKGHDEIIKFIFSIRDFRKYNIDSYDNMLQYIDNFLKLHEDLKNCTLHPYMHIDVMKNNAKNALNYLHSIIHNLSPNDLILNKHQKAINILNSLLTFYLNKEIDKLDKFIETNGYNIHTKKIYKDELDSFSFDKSSINSSHFELL